MLDCVSHKGFSARAQAVPSLSGYNLALGHRTPTQRALIGAEMFLGRLRFVEPRVSQVVDLVHVSRPMVEAAIALVESDNIGLLSAVGVGQVALLEAAVLVKHPPKTLVETFVTSSQADRAVLAKTAGPTALWDELVAPFI